MLANNQHSHIDSSEKIVNDRRRSCHRCGNIRRETFECSNCPQVYCSRCAQKMLEEYTYLGFQNGCPACGGLCCCSAKSKDCQRKVHCYKKCPKAKSFGKDKKIDQGLDISDNEENSKKKHQSYEDEPLSIWQQQSYKSLREYVNIQYPQVHMASHNEFVPFNDEPQPSSDEQDRPRKKRRRRERITQDRIISDTLNPVPYLQSQIPRNVNSNNNQQYHSRSLPLKSNYWDTALTNILKQLTQKSDPFTPLLARYYGHGQEISLGYTNSLPSLRDLINKHTQRSSHRLFSITSSRFSHEIDDQQHHQFTTFLHQVPMISSSRLPTPSHGALDATPTLLPNDIFSHPLNTQHQDDLNNMMIHTDNFEDFLFSPQQPLPLSSLQSSPQQNNLHDLYQLSHQFQQSHENDSEDLFDTFLHQPLLLQCQENKTQQINHDQSKDWILSHRINSSNSTASIHSGTGQQVPFEYSGTQQRPVQHSVSWDGLFFPTHSNLQAPNVDQQYETQFLTVDESNIHSESSSTTIPKHHIIRPQFKTSVTTSAMTHLLQALEQSENEDIMFSNKL